MDDAHPSELADEASSSGEKQNARRVAWVEHRSTTYAFPPTMRRANLLEIDRYVREAIKRLAVL